MPQNWTNNDEDAGGTLVRQGFINLEEKLDTVRSSFSGTAFPVDDDRYVGQVCWRTDAAAVETLTDEETGVGLYILTTKAASSVDDVWTFVIGDAGLTQFGESLNAAVDAAAARTLIGVGSAGQLTAGTAGGEVQTNSQNQTTFLQRTNDLDDVSSASTARDNLGLGGLSTLDSVGTAQIGAAAVTKAKLEQIERSYTPTNQAGTYSASAMDYVNCTLGTSDSWTLTLPASPAAGQKVLVRIAAIGSGSILTIDGGTNDIGVSGTSEIHLYSQDDIVELQYDGSLWLYLNRSLSKHICQISLSNISSFASAAWTEVGFDTADVDTASMSNLTNNAIEIRKTGKYRVSANVLFGQVGPSWHAVRVMKNGSRLTPQVTSLHYADGYPSGEHDETLTGAEITRVYSLTSGDELTVDAYVTSLDTSAENQVHLSVEEI